MQAEALVKTGLAAAGFNSVHLDDCIMAPERDPSTHRLLADPNRFPSGFAALGSYIHGLNLSFAMYTAESDTTCAGLPGSRGYETLDASTFAEWGADYLKADGCGDPTYYAQGYAAMGAALQATGRDIVFSCSWPVSAAALSAVFRLFNDSPYCRLTSDQTNHASRSGP